MPKLPRLNARKTARAGISALLALSAATTVAMGNRPRADDEAVAFRIQAVARVETAAAASALTGERSGEEIVNGICGVCHVPGVAGAPKIGDKAAWAPRLVQGLDGLAKSATAGKNAMPPRGGANLNPIELTKAIVFMTNMSGANFKEPTSKKK